MEPQCIRDGIKISKQGRVGYEIQRCKRGKEMKISRKRIDGSRSKGKQNQNRRSKEIENRNHISKEIQNQNCRSGVRREG